MNLLFRLFVVRQIKSIVQNNPTIKSKKNISLLFLETTLTKDSYSNIFIHIKDRLWRCYWKRIQYLMSQPTVEHAMSMIP